MSSADCRTWNKSAGLVEWGGWLVARWHGVWGGDDEEGGKKKTEKRD